MLLLHCTNCRYGNKSFSVRLAATYCALWKALCRSILLLDCKKFTLKSSQNLCLIKIPNVNLASGQMMLLLNDETRALLIV